MNEHALIIVESPTKAKMIKKFLGKDCTVLACMGHVRDLPQKAADIPADIKKQPWTRIGINVKDDFKPLYIIPANKHKTLAELRKALKDADTVYLATDEDREGESISWHLLEVLKPKVPTKRMVFHEITAKAIKDAFAHPRELDMKLVRAQETRRILDRLVGYTLSPLIWKKIAFGLSAGRVQSTALRVLVDLELERMKFKSANYWGISAQLAKGNSQAFEAKLTGLGEQKIASGKDFDEHTGKLIAGRKVILLEEKAAQDLLKEAQLGDWTVTDLDEKPVSRRPAPPFITSTLQQEANRKLGLSAREAMRIAQSLYENGYITYMRTDSVSLSEAAIQSARDCVNRLFGKSYMSPEPRRFTTKSKGAQEAHEAIRPSLNFTPPQDTNLRGRERDLYEMIWMRTIATQMEDAKQLQVSATITVPTKAGQLSFHASGMRILFPGFLKAYVEGFDDPDKALAEREKFLPDLKVKDGLNHVESEVTEHETKPPSRYSEASLIQFLEKEGIGRPSTYATIVSTILDRGYARKINNALVPTFTGIVVIQLMSKHFHELVDFKFTSNMEERLDEIAEGKIEYLPYLEEFYLGKTGLEQRVADEDKKIKPEEARTLHLAHLSNLEIFVGKYGPYFEYTDPKSGEIFKASVPDDLAPSDLNDESIGKIVEQVKRGPQSIGIDPETKLPIYLKTGSYGPYLQVGDVPKDEKQKLKRVSIPKGIDPLTLDEKTAQLIITLPRLLGINPDNGKEVRASVGRFGPYIVCEKDYRSLKKDDHVLYVTFERAMELLRTPKTGRRRGATVLKALGEHPETKEAVEILEGIYGAYIKCGKINATLPKDAKPEDFTLAQAVVLLAERAPQKSAAKKTKKAPKKTTKAKKEIETDDTASAPKLKKTAAKASAKTILAIKKA